MAITFMPRSPIPRTSARRSRRCRASPPQPRRPRTPAPGSAPSRGVPFAGGPPGGRQLNSGDGAVDRALQLGGEGVHLSPPQEATCDPGRVRADGARGFLQPEPAAAAALTPRGGVRRWSQPWLGPRPQRWEHRERGSGLHAPCPTAQASRCRLTSSAGLGADLSFRRPPPAGRAGPRRRPSMGRAAPPGPGVRQGTPVS